MALNPVQILWFQCPQLKFWQQMPKLWTRFTLSKLLLFGCMLGKSSLANTFARYLRHPKDIPTPMLTQDNPDLLCTQVMQLYDGLSIDKMKDLSVQVEELTPSVKLVKLKSNVPVKVGRRQRLKNKLVSLYTIVNCTRAPAETAEEFQLKMVDIGGHTATALKAFHSVHRRSSLCFS